MVTDLLKDLVSPSEEVIEWVAEAMRTRHQTTEGDNATLASSIKLQLERLTRMDNNLYDDKLAGEITPERYSHKHAGLIAEKAALEERLGKIDCLGAQRLERKLVLLELSQKAAELYPKKTPEQKRIIITKLFNSLVYNNGSIEVSYTNFSRAIAQNVQLTHHILGGAK